MLISQTLLKFSKIIDSVRWSDIEVVKFPVGY